MKRDRVAPVRKSKIRIPAASYRIFRHRAFVKKRITIHHLNSSRAAPMNRDP
jgi:hypothetical protein